MKHTVNDALRMVGQLLMNSPTTGYLARNQEGFSVDPISTEACSFCFVGAIYASCYKLKVTHGPVAKAAVALTGIRLGTHWDYAGAGKQMDIARKLASVTDP